MDKLLQKNDETGAKINTLARNYHKDGDIRKTKSYLEKKIEELKKLYAEFLATDDQIILMDPPIKEDHPYRTMRSTIAETNKDLLTEMRQRLNNGPPLTPTVPLVPLSSASKQKHFDFPSKEMMSKEQPTTPPPSSSSDRRQPHDDLKCKELSNTNQKLLKRQDALMRILYRKMDSIEQTLDNNNSPIEYLKLKVDQLSKEIEVIDQQHIDILVEMDEEDESNKYLQNNYYETLKERVDILIMRLQRNQQKETTILSEETRVHLPKIQLPTFYGDYEQWSAFNDIFTELIHNNNQLSDTLKMTYLKSNVQKGAAQLISHLATTGDNYNKAWEILQARYNNTRLLANKYFNSLMSLPTIHAASAVTIRTLHDTATEILHNISKLQISSPFEALVMFILGKKLDPESTRLYETTLENPRKIKQISDFFNFLERRFQSLEAMGVIKVANTPPQPMAPLKRVHATTVNSQCLVKRCQGRHQLQDCNQFKLMPTLDRNKLVSDTSTCVRCLTQHPKGISRNSCTSTIRCIVCQGQHHTLLHGNNMASTNKGTAQTLIVKQQGPVLLPTAVVRIATGTGKLNTIRVLIDSGSQATLISSKAANLLSIKKKKAHINISGIGGTEAGICRHTINIKLTPRFNENFTLDIEALVLNNLTQQLPAASIDTTKWSHLQNLELADPQYNQPQPVDLVLGADYYPSIVTSGIIKGGHEEPMAQNTEFGWIIIGSMGNTDDSNRTTMVTTKAIEEQLKLLVENDNIPEKRSHTEEETQVEEHFKTTVVRGADGKFIVRIPFKDNPNTLGESRKRAVARLLQIERRFMKDPNYKKLYHKFMQEYIDLNHMELIQERRNDEQAENTYYIPHHGVIKDSSTTTRLRVVFDASSKTTSGVSLNDIMMTGPKLQEELTDILLRWRKHKVVMTADIEKMYRQVWINKRDRDYQRILWRSDPSQPINAYRLNTVTYGTSAGSYLAVRALLQLAQEGASTHPTATNIISTDFYVDDVLTGTDSVEEALIAINELQELTAQGGFQLRKWTSNKIEIIKHIPDEQLANGNIQIKLNDCIKTLGILYNPHTDCFEFDIAQLQLTTNQPTKRSLLSDSSKLFDPVGWLSPITIMAKIMMQEVWMTGINWDNQLPEKIRNKWLSYKDELIEISNIKIPRWLNTRIEGQKELHGFADASEQAYAATVYCRNIDSNGKVTTQLVTAKTRVAPIKTKLSIPRLELKAAVLLAKLLKHVQNIMQLQNVKTYAWSDSTITLCWIKGDPSRFKTFVANRISVIKETLPSTTWQHIKSEDNPADMASRGITPSELVNNNLWWHGPQFLTTTPLHWETVLASNSDDELQEQEKQLLPELEEKVVIATMIKESHFLSNVFNKISSYNKIRRIVAYCWRFTDNSRHKNINKESLTVQELQRAEELILKLSQGQDFSQDIECIKKSKKLHKGSKLASLHPGFDDKGLLRAMGRLQNSNLSIDSKQPIILSKNNIITQRIIEEAHQRTLHGGIQSTLGLLRNKYWIIDGRRAVRQIINKCVKCFRHKQTNMEQLMGRLPPSRVRPGRPFAKTGIDYAGPIQLRTTQGRGHKSFKGYIALFVCMVTKAIHIELVSNLTTEGFIAAYKRFISRRGLCTDIYSDNGTYFIGANAKIKKCHQTAMTSLPGDIAAILAEEGTNWHFIPPHTPHFGGLWEAGIKSVKFHLKRVIGETTLTFEELYTVLTQVEAVLNSRPLTPLTNDISDLAALTPGHFLIGDSLKALPTADIEEKSLRTRWHLVEKMVQDFWKRWSSEYLHQLHQRNKWTIIQPNLMVNDLVLLKDEQQPATRWKLGRVLDTHIGSDNLVRTATVKCKDATYKRPIIKLCKLPIQEPSEEPPPAQKIPLITDETLKNDVSSSGPDLSDAPRRQPSRRVKTVGKINMVALTMLSVCCLLGLGKPDIQLKPFNQSIGIYFERLGKLEIVAMEWTLVIQYNMSSYWDEIKNVKLAHEEIQALCNELPLSNCNILNQLQWQLRNLIADNELLLASNKDQTRVKRGFGDATGIILGDMFGILTQREASDYENHFEKINNNEHHLLSLIKNTTTLIDNTVKLVKHNTNLTLTSINNLIKEQKHLRNEMSQLQEYRTYEDRARSIIMSILELSLVLRNLEDTQQGLLDVVYDAHHGIIHPAILTPTQLNRELQFIRQHVPASITIPGHNLYDLTHVYKSMKTRTRVTQRSVIIEITLPLAFTWDYTLLSVIPLPDINHGSTQSYIIKTTDYLAVDDRREHFATLTKEDVNRCQLFQPTRFLCKLSPIYNTMTKQGQCELALLQRKKEVDMACNSKTINGTNHWIKLHTPNQWIYAIPNETIVDVICDSKIQPHKFQGSGLVEIRPGCMLRDAESLIIATGTAHNNIKNAFHNSPILLHEGNHLKDFNVRVQNKMRETQQVKLLTAPITTELENQIATLEQNEILPPNQSVHHVHHYAMIHLIFWSGILIIGIWGIRRLCRRKPSNSPRPPSPLPPIETSAV